MSVNTLHASAVTADLAPAPLTLPSAFNYIGVFLTFACPYRCAYCINRHDPNPQLNHHLRSGADWVNFFERIDTRDVPITLQGGEPGMHPDFMEIVARLSHTRSVDILTNLAFDLDAFIKCVSPRRMNRPAPYAPIRASYHPTQFSLETIVERLLTLQDAGFRVGLYGVTHPEQMDAIDEARRVCQKRGLDFRTKPFLGWHNNQLHGEYAWPEACNGKTTYDCECAPGELLLAPDGNLHRCHYYLYNQLTPLDNISNLNLVLTDEYLPCRMFGLCNPCDVKIKNNRFQQFGHVTAHIRNITPIANNASIMS